MNMRDESSGKIYLGLSQKFAQGPLSPFQEFAPETCGHSVPKPISREPNPVHSPNLNESQTAHLSSSRLYTTICIIDSKVGWHTQYFFATRESDNRPLRVVVVGRELGLCGGATLETLFRGNWSSSLHSLLRSTKSDHLPHRPVYQLPLHQVLWSCVLTQELVLEAADITLISMTCAPTCGV